MGELKTWTNANNLRSANTWDAQDTGLKECVESLKENVILAGLWIIKMREGNLWRDSWDTLEDYFTGPVDAGGCGFASYETPTRWARVAQKYVIELGLSLQELGATEHTKLDLLSSRATSENIQEILTDCQPKSFGGLSVTSIKEKWMDVTPTPMKDDGLSKPFRVWPFANAPQKFKDLFCAMDSRYATRSNSFIIFRPFDMLDIGIVGEIQHGQEHRVGDGWVRLSEVVDESTP